MMVTHETIVFMLIISTVVVAILFIFFVVYGGILLMSSRSPKQVMIGLAVIGLIVGIHLVILYKIASSNNLSKQQIIKTENS
jgi:hypothetical protein